MTDPAYKGMPDTEFLVQDFKDNFSSMIPVELAESVRYSPSSEKTIAFLFENYSFRLGVYETFAARECTVEDGEGNRFRPVNLDFRVSFPSVELQLGEQDLYLERLTAVCAFNRALAERFGSVGYSFMSSRIGREKAEAKQAASEFCAQHKDKLAKLKKGKTITCVEIQFTHGLGKYPELEERYSLGKKVFRVSVQNGVATIAREA